MDSWTFRLLPLTGVDVAPVGKCQEEKQHMESEQMHLEIHILKYKFEKISRSGSWSFQLMKNNVVTCLQVAFLCGSMLGLVHFGCWLSEWDWFGTCQACCSFRFGT